MASNLLHGSAASRGAMWRATASLVSTELGDTPLAAAVIVHIGHPGAQGRSPGSVHQFNGRVVAKLHPVRDVADLGASSGRRPGRPSMELVLRRGKPRPALPLREVKERTAGPGGSGRAGYSAWLTRPPRVRVASSSSSWDRPGLRHRSMMPAASRPRGAGRDLEIVGPTHFGDDRVTTGR